MKYIRITNKGLIDPKALHLVGASTKKNDTTKIGQFGSGNKYAIAYFLRHEYDLKIFAGLEEISITTKEEKFRDQDFNIIHINGEKTSITTQMGSKWEFWQAIREVYCNALDEGGCTLDFVQEMIPTEGETHFYIDTKKDVMEFMVNFDDYFATKKKVLFECEYGRILEKTGTNANIYRKGIKCHNTDLTSAYDYDLKEIKVDENRLVMYTWQIEEKIWKLIFKCDNVEVIKQILHNSSNTENIEGCIADFSTINSSQISDVFKATLNSLNLAPKGYAGLLKPDEIKNHIILPTKVFSSVRGLLDEETVGDRFKVTKKGAMFRMIENVSDLQNATLKKAMDFFQACNYPIDYDIRVVMFDEAKILGTAYGETILLSELCIQEGANMVVQTIIEEQIHIRHQVKDETRAFQDASISEFVNYMKKMNVYEL